MHTQHKALSRTIECGAIDARAAHRQGTASSGEMPVTTDIPGDGSATPPTPSCATNARNRDRMPLPSTAISIDSRPCRSGRVQRIPLNEALFIFVKKK
jgi:hypothetical protein